MVTIFENREDIIISRLAYLQYLIDTSKGEDKSKLKDMYNALRDVSFVKGRLRTPDELYEYVMDTMRANKGKIPGLPDNNAIEEIDTGFKKLIKFDSQKCTNLINDVKKTLIKDTPDTDAANNKELADAVLGGGEKSGKEIKDKLSKTTTKLGLTNVLGLEKDMTMSETDKSRGEAVKKAKDGISGKEPVEVDKKKEDEVDKSSNKSPDKDKSEPGK